MELTDVPASNEGESSIPGLVGGLLGGILGASPPSRMAGLLATTAPTLIEIDVPIKALTQASNGRITPRDFAQGAGAVTGGAVALSYAGSAVGAGLAAAGVSTTSIDGLDVTFELASGAKRLRYTKAGPYGFVDDLVRCDTVGPSR